MEEWARTWRGWVKLEASLESGREMVGEEVFAEEDREMAEEEADKEA